MPATTTLSLDSYVPERPFRLPLGIEVLVLLGGAFVVRGWAPYSLSYPLTREYWVVAALLASPSIDMREDEDRGVPQISPTPSLCQVDYIAVFRRRIVTRHFEKMPCANTTVAYLATVCN